MKKINIIFFLLIFTSFFIGGLEIFFLRDIRKAIPIYFDKDTILPDSIPESPTKDGHLHLASRPVDSGYFHGIYPQVLENLKNSEVLFVGTSPLIYAVSTQKIDNYFKSNDLKYHILSFEGARSALLPIRIIEKHQLAPKLIIVDLNRGISHMRKETAEILEKSRFYTYDLVVAKLFLKMQVHKTLNYVKNVMFWPREPVRHKNISEIWMSKATGARIWPGPHRKETLPVPSCSIKLGNLRDKVNKYTMVDEIKMVKRYKRTGAKILFLTTPVNGKPAVNKREIADKTDASFLSIEADGLSGDCIDHLDYPSAQIWSEAFLQKLTLFCGARLIKCFNSNSVD